MEHRRQTFLQRGDPAPWFSCATRTNPDYSFPTVAGRYVMISFLGSGSSPEATALMQGVRANRKRFDDKQMLFFGVCNHADLDRPELQDAIPGLRFFWDLSRSVSGLYGADVEGSDRLVTYLLDPTLRVLVTLPNADTGHWSKVQAALDALPPLPVPAPVGTHAPVLVLPRVFEPELCRTLIAYYDKIGGGDSGFMRQVGGMTKGIVDYGFKRRRDCEIADETLRNACMTRVYHRLLPEIEKAFQFRVTRMERYIVSCYDAAERGHFQAHRDNITKGTAHRRFAVSLFLNAGEYEGGHLRFPEFSTALYSAPVGGAVVFGCSLLHEAMPVTRGKRYMFLPFLYDDAAAKIREENLKYLESAPAQQAAGSQGKA